MLLACLAGLVYVFVVFSQPAVIQELREQQAAAMEKQVESGKLTRAQAEQAEQVMERFSSSGITKVFGAVGVVGANLVRVFWWGLIVWLVGRFAMGSTLGYGKALEVVGLATTIGVLGGIVSLLLAVAMGSVHATASPALLVQGFDPKNVSHAILGGLNVFELWMTGVASRGLAVVAGSSFGKAAVWLYAHWLVLAALFIGLGQIQFRT
jgi:hypothetical protein